MDKFRSLESLIEWTMGVSELLGTNELDGKYITTKYIIWNGLDGVKQVEVEVEVDYAGFSLNGFWYNRNTAKEYTEEFAKNFAKYEILGMPIWKEK